MHDEEPKFIHIGQIVQRPAFMRSWERKRHTQAHWLIECIAEFTGVFLYCYAGIGSQASMVMGAIADEPYLGSLLQVGLAYGVGIVLAVTICSGTSNGHFNPCITITFALFKGFPWKKVPRYIISQILGGFVACLIVYLQWRNNILALETALEAAGKLDAIQFTPSGPAGIFGMYAQPGANLGVVFANEFFVDFILALTIFSCIDPSNFFCPPSVVPYTIGLAYAMAVWSYSPNGLAANTARDLGGRLAALAIWQDTRAGGGSYAAIAALTNIGATVLAAVVYEVVFFDSYRVLPPAQRDYLFGHKAHALQADEAYGTNNAAAHPLRHPHDPHRHDQAELASTSSHDKVNYEHKV